MIGNARASAELGGIAISLWAVAYGWYFWLGAGRLSSVWKQLMIRLRIMSAGDAKPRRSRDGGAG